MSEQVLEKISIREPQPTIFLRNRIPKKILFAGVGSRKKLCSEAGAYFIILPESVSVSDSVSDFRSGLDSDPSLALVLQVPSGLLLSPLTTLYISLSLKIT